MNTNKYFMYVRKSSETEDRQVASIDSQKEVLTKLAKDRGFNIIETFTEAKSAKAPGRLVFNKMIEKIHKGEADGIICWKLDRLFRNPIDFGQISWMLQQGIIKHIQCSDRSYYPEDNVLLMSVEQGMANQFIRDLSRNTKRGLKSKAERGWYPAQPPLGYLHNPLKKKGDKEMIKDPDTFDGTRKMFDMMLSGAYLPSQLVRLINSEMGIKNRFGRKVGKTTIYHILRNPFYYGYFEYPKGSGNWIKGKHEPMITKAEYDKIQRFLDKRYRHKPEVKEFAFTGLIKCAECDSSITAEDKEKHQKNGNVHIYTYYHCTKKKKRDCSQKTVEVKNLEAQISEVLESISIPEDFISWAMEILQRDLMKDMSDRKNLLKTHRSELATIHKNVDKLIDLKLSGVLDDKEFLQKKAKYKDREMELQTIIAKLEEDASADMESLESLLKFGQAASEVFRNGSVEQKRMILSSLGSNLLLKDRKLEISLEKPLLLLKEINDFLKGERVENSRLEPPQVQIKKGTYSVFNTINPLVLRE